MNSATRRLLAALPVVAGIAITLASTASAGTDTIRALAYPKSADLQVRARVELANVTVGHLAAVDLSVYNRGFSDATTVTLTATLPAESKLVQVTQSNGSCSASAGVLTCNLAPIPRQWAVYVQVILRMPHIAGPQVTSVKVRGRPTDPNLSDNQSATTVHAVPKNHDSVSGVVLPSGGTLATPGTVTENNPTGTTARIPLTPYIQRVVISEHSTTDTAMACGDGYVCFGQYVQVSGFYTDPVKPARVAIRFDASSIPNGASITHTKLFNQGAIVIGCRASSNGAAAPDPCVESRTVLPDGDWRLVVRATQYLELRL
jgi:uncharacterized protein DUF11